MPPAGYAIRRNPPPLPSPALRRARGIRAKLATLSNNPLCCPIDPDSVAYGEEVRVLLHGKKQGQYRILFAVRGDTVHILTVRHAARRSLAEELHSEEPNDEGPSH